MANLRLGGDGFIASPPELAPPTPVPDLSHAKLTLLGAALALLGGFAVRKRASLAALVVLLSFPLVMAEDGSGMLTDLPGLAAGPAYAVSDAAGALESAPAPDPTAVSALACQLPEVAETAGGSCTASRPHSLLCGADATGRAPDGGCRALCAASAYEVLCRSADDRLTQPPPPSAALGCTAARIPTDGHSLVYCCPCR
jgi:hypothetical protein